MARLVLRGKTPPPIGYPYTKFRADQQMSKSGLSSSGWPGGRRLGRGTVAQDSGRSPFNFRTFPPMSKSGLSSSGWPGGGRMGRDRPVKTLGAAILNFERFGQCPKMAWGRGSGGLGMAGQDSDVIEKPPLKTLRFPAKNSAQTPSAHARLGSDTTTSLPQFPFIF